MSINFKGWVKKHGIKVGGKGRKKTLKVDVS